MSTAQLEIAELRSKLEDQERQFENYKAECKGLEELLEQESTKKDGEIKKLKDEAMKKEKAQTALKTQIAALETELNALKNQSNTNANQKNEVDELRTKLIGQQAKSYEKDTKIVELQNKINELSAKTTTQSNQIKILQDQCQSYKANEDVLRKQKQSSKIPISQSPSKVSMPNPQLVSLQAKIKAQQTEIQQLHRRIKAQQANSPERRNYNETIFTQTSPLASFEAFSNLLNTQCLIMTKRHYVSPYLDVVDKHTLRLYKNNKNGVFEKSLGASKHKVGSITHNPEEIVEGVMSRMPSQDSFTHIILVAGNSGGQLALLKNLWKTIKAKYLGNLSMNFQLLYLSSQSTTRRIEVSDHGELQKLQATIFQSNEGEAGPPVKVEGRKGPKVVYFKLSFGSSSIELAMTGHLSGLRDTFSIQQAMNATLFSHIPSSLQDATASKQIIIVLNPIVSLYDECRSALCLVSHRKEPSSSKDLGSSAHLEISPMKAHLSDSVRRKVEGFQKETQQLQTKNRRKEEDCRYYRAKFDELQLRLKQLINTQNNQNSYLKKSPVTLAYEKLLRFVHTVLGRTTEQSESFSAIQLNTTHDEMI